MEPPEVMPLRYAKSIEVQNVRNGSRELQHDNVWTWLFYASIVAMIVYVVLSRLYK
jgi:hypothetical protein